MTTNELLSACDVVDRVAKMWLERHPESEQMAAARALAAWVREQCPADSDEPVTEEWLREIGFKYTEDRYGSADWWELGQVKYYPNTGWDVCCHQIKSPESRGQVRSLLCALGMEAARSR